MEVNSSLFKQKQFVARSKTVPYLEEVLQTLLASVCHVLLSLFYDLQDALLAITWIRRLMTYSLAPSCKQAILKKLVAPQQNRDTFDNLKYHVSEDVQQLLVHSSLHAMLWPNLGKRVSSELPPPGRVLLQTSTGGTAKFQETVAAALASKVQANLLVIDNALLAQISQKGMGAALEPSEDGEEPTFSLTAFLLSFWLSGGRMAFVWEVLRRVCDGLDRPLMLFVHDVERTLCGSFERYDAFEDAFGAGKVRTPKIQLDRTAGVDSLVLPLVLIGGCTLGESGTHLAPASAGRGKRGEEQGERPDGPPFGAGEDDMPPPFLPSAAELGLHLPEDKPNFRKLLHSLFMTRIKLDAPASGAAASAHNQQIALDAEAMLSEQNYAQLTSLAPDMSKRSLPAPDSAVYRQRLLSRNDWAKVLTWAASMQFAMTAKDSKGGLEAMQQRLRLPAPADAAPDPAKADVLHAQDPSDVQPDTSSAPFGGRGTAPMPSLREAGADSDDSSPQPLDGPLHTDDAIALSRATSEETAAAETPLLQHGPAEDVKDLPTASAGAGGKHGADVQQRNAPRKEALVISEAAIWYGIRMLERAGGGVRQSIKADNAYERRLLSEVSFQLSLGKLIQEVVAPEDAGAGFSEVGALEAAKTALREAVQLPLQHPHLFTRGSLARPCKGVLLFGPPGTGKTLLARAAAAECGASFLALTPSSVASKWLGDGVRSVRAAFSLAAKLAPCVLFVDEVDALLARRGAHGEHEALREMKNEFMAQWDGIRPGGSGGGGDRVLVLGATNRPYDLDEAVLRRFPRRVFCPLPNRAARQEILDVLLAGEQMDEGLRLGSIAERTDGFSGSDLRHLCTAAAMRPLRELLKSSSKAKPSRAKQKRGASDQVAEVPSSHSVAAQDDRSGLVSTTAAEPQPSSSAQPSTQRSSSGPQADGLPNAPANGHVRAASASSTSSAFAGDSSDSHADLDAAIDSAASQEDVPLPAGAGTSQPQRSQSPPGSDGAPNALASMSASNAAQPRDDELDQGSGDGTLQQGSTAASSDFKALAGVLGLLLEQCSAMADSAAAQAHRPQLRPLSQADFEDALKEVAPASADKSSAAMSELLQWNAQYGEGADRNYLQHLSYFV